MSIIYELEQKLDELEKLCNKYKVDSELQSTFRIKGHTLNRSWRLNPKMQSKG